MTFRNAHLALIELARDEEGLTIVEFAIVAPVFLLMIIGLMDLGQLVYARSILQGSVEIAARSSSLETGDTTAADQMIEGEVQKIAPDAQITASRVSYFDFADLERAELWNDANGNGDCDNDETYTDENGNGSWDADIGVSGNGGAGDVVMYDVTISFDRIFKVPLLPGADSYEIDASAIRKNQPFADQQNYGSTAGSCD